MNLIYPACFYPEDNGQYSVVVPDLDGASTYGNSLEDAMSMAQDLIGSWVLDAIEHSEEIPKPSQPQTIDLEYENGFMTLITINMAEYERLHGKKSIKKTLTIPAWMNSLAEKEGLNFSSLLQNAIIKELDLKLD